MNARLWIAAAVFGLAGTAMGQYALDKNLQVGSGGRNGPGRDFKKEMEFRNAIVTGNAPGGISFRGDVGYRAPGEFFGSLGSNDTFGFRRDSAYSGLGGLGLRGTDALQYQFAVTTGNAPPSGMTGIPIFERSGASGSPTASPTARPDGFTDLGVPKRGDYGYDARGLSLMSVRSPSSYMANRGLQPTLLGRGESGTETKAITASMLRGVAYDDIGVLGLRTPTTDKEDKRPPTAAPSSAVTTAAPSSQGQSTGLSTQVHTAYDDLVDRLKQGTADAAKQDQRGAERPGDVKKDDGSDWQHRINDLRDRLRDKSRPATKPGDGVTKPGDQPGTAPQKGGDKGQDKGQNKGQDKGQQAPSGTDTDTAGIIRRAGEKVTALSSPSYDPYGTQMQAGQEHLAAGRYFDAEERFTAALSAKPGDPMAMVGRIHAQLGAGMFLSAAINLRGLLTEHPELMGMKYGEHLLPAGERKGMVLARLGELVAETDGRGRDPGLLLAYVGYQTGDKAALKRGLDAMRAGAAADGDQLSRLAAVLTKVWTEGEGAAPEPKK